MIINEKRHFAKDPDFVFTAQQMVERGAIERQIDCSMKKGRHSKNEDGSINLKNPENSLSIFKSIPGTCSYWKSYRSELFARMEQLGPFHLFFTLSCAEQKWPEVFVSLLHMDAFKVEVHSGWHEDENKITINGIPLPEFKEHHLPGVTSFLKDEFVHITRIFDNRLKAFIKNIICAGDVEHYTYRIEFQARGLPHAHGVIWLKQDKIKQYLNEEGTFDEEKAVPLIDEWISVSLENESETLNNLVKNYNVHKHTKSCLKYGKCRFGFPKVPSPRTIIAVPLPDDMDEKEKEEKLYNAQKTIDKVMKEIEDLGENARDETLNSVLSKLGISEEKYVNALKISRKGKVVVLKRTIHEMYVNNYNDTYLSAWRANMDIQLCMDVHSVITYITDYVTKDDSGLTELLQKALNEKTFTNDFERLNYLKKIYFTYKQVNTCEATYRLINGLCFKGANIKKIFVSSNLPQNRSHFFRKVLEIEENGEENPECVNEEDVQELDSNEQEEQPDTSDDVVEIEGRDGKFRQVKTNFMMPMVQDHLP